MNRICIALVAVALALTGVTPSPAPASATASTSPGEGYAPLHRPGPRLSVPRSELRNALDCHGSPRADKRPVLLSPGTSVTPEQNFAWNYMKAFTAQGRYWCAVTMPHHTYGDIQVAGEHLVFAIRRMHRRTGRRIAVVGHSQGGMNPRWALRFWPDTRRKVADLIGMAPSNHGTTAIQQCVEGATTCAPAIWQQRDEAQLIKAVNSRAETFRGISYTNITTERDEVVTPMTSSFLHTGRGRIRNIPVQDICPAAAWEHNFVGTVDPVAYALVMDAITHRGPADPARIDPGVCNQAYMPYVDPASLDFVPAVFAAPSMTGILVPFASAVGAPMLSREPELRCYVFARC